MTRFGGTATVALAACLSVACDRQTAKPLHTAIDSAGITISVSTAPQWAEGEGWTIADSPHVDIGSSDAQGHDLYEVNGVARLSDGRIAIVNSGSSEVRLFSPEGELLQTLGGNGEGPGEFRSLRRAFVLPGDSLLVVDASLDRLTLFSSGGSLVRTAAVAPPPTGSSPAPLARLPDGSLISFPPFVFGSSSGGESRVIQDTVPLLRYDADGRYVGELGRFPGSEYFVFMDGSRFLGGPRMWGRTTHVAPLDDGFVVGHSADFSFRIHDAEGTLRHIVRARLPNRPVTEADLDLFRTPDPDVDRATDAMFNRLLDALPPPSHFPAYAGILVDSEDHIWVERYVWPEGDAGQEWQVFDPEGRWLGAVTLPAGFFLAQVMTEEVLGIYRDDLDVEHVRAYRLERN